MAKRGEITEVGIGMTDGYRYLDIKPPLREKELTDMGARGVIGAFVARNNEQIDDILPAVSQIMVSGDFDSLTPESRTIKAQQMAKELAEVLRSMRPNHTIRVNSEPVPLMGHHSNSFNPYTDRRGSQEVPFE